MEKQKTQRIIGSLVVGALIIGVAPLVIGKSDFSAQTATNVKAPPFPNQQPTTTTAAETKEDVAITPDIAKNVNDAVEATTLANAAATTEQLQPYMLPTAKPAITVPTANLPTPQLNTNKLADAQSTTPVAAPIAVAPAEPEPSTAIIQTPKQVAHTKAHPAAQLKTPAWAIQMGSFKVKQNATQLANKLRTAGYKAFIREMKAANGHNSLRVYVGPEFKQASAKQLSHKIQQNFNIAGIVVPYKPLEI